MNNLTKKELMMVDMNTLTKKEVMMVHILANHIKFQVSLYHTSLKSERKSILKNIIMFCNEIQEITTNP